MSEVEFGVGPYYTLNKKITRKALPLFDGFGLFAVEPIKEGEVCWRGCLDENNLEMEIDEVEKWDEEAKENFHHYAYQIGKTRMRCTKDVNLDYSVFW